MKAIRTRFLPATNTKGSRIVAECEGGNKVIIARKYGMEIEDNEKLAVQTLMDKLNWPYDVNLMAHGGGLNGDTYWVFK